MSMELKTGVTQLFETETQRRIIDYALHDMDSGKWYRTGEIAEEIGKTRNATTNAIQPREGTVGPMIRFGVLEPKHNPMNMPNIPHYGRAETPVMELLQSWGDYSLLDLFETTTAQKLVTFFLFEGDDDVWSANQIRHEGPFSFEGVAKNIEKLVDSGLVTEVEKPRTTAYQLDTGSEMYQFLGELNGAVMDVSDTFQ